MTYGRFIKLFFSILTAVATGASVGMVGVASFDAVYSKAETPEDLTANLSILEEADQDPTFVSRFSRVFIYSADDNREIIESAKNSINSTINKKVTALSYVVMDMDRDVLVLEKEADKLLPIASITKLVTAVVAKKLMNDYEFLTVTKPALSTYGNEARLREGEKLRVSELMYPLLMVSSNDTSEVLARGYIGGRKKFIAEMNNWVESIGAYRTSFTDPSGLSPRNVSTSKDLSIIVKWILENEPEIFEISKQKAKTIRTHTWTNPTHFLNLASYIGGKNGYIPEADRTSVSLFELGKQKRTYAVILLGSSSRDNDILDLLDEAVR